ncbi:hypothetical protein EVAR_90633_1 [Eumeta japonica]|uniref:Uncharacterized protein n=1 Tax=Eumeta variegata TaxID=151549 RepID=A0A4C1ZV55_EUMVA|nr:hypothetical protein EVAR_90633_1 [Eumeta japonica]
MDEQLRRYFYRIARYYTETTVKRSRTTSSQYIERIHDTARRRALSNRIVVERTANKMPNNYENAMKRLITTEKKIDRDVELRNKYKEQMKALVNKGTLKEHRCIEQRTEPGTCHISGHKRYETGKIRVVHDRR